MDFDPKRHVIKVQGGREYLPVSARLVWFRKDHPDWGIVTEAMEINYEKQYAVFRASIFNEEGRLIATGTKKEDVKGFGDYMEKAETGAVGRALAMCGYGTQFAPELEESRFDSRGSRPMPPRPQGAAPPRPLVPRPAPEPGPAEDRYDEPQMRSAPRPAPPERPAPAPVERPMAAERPAPPAERPAPTPERRTPPVDLPDDLPPLRPASSLTRPTPRPAPPTDMPAPVARPVPAGAPIQRVREPERDLPDPGGPDDDLEDPFADDDAPPARPAARPVAPTGRPPARRPGRPDGGGLL